MEQDVIRAVKKRVKEESFAQKMGFNLVELSEGHAIVEMKPDNNNLNIFNMIHGGAIFSLIDEAFQVSCNSYGTVAVALNMSVTYHRAPETDKILYAESNEIHKSRKTATYEIVVKDEKDQRIASCTALAYRKKESLPFLE